MNKRSYSIRRLLCYFLSIVLAFTLLGSNMLMVSSLTIGNKHFVQKYFSTPRVTNELSLELDKRLEEIADNYDLDAEILTSVFPYDYRISAQKTAMNSLYNSHCIPVSSSLNVDIRCENAVARYNLKQNKGKELSDKKTEELIDDVKEALDSVYAVTNAGEFSSVSEFFSASTKGAVVLSVASVIIAAAVYLISGWSHGSLNFIAMALETAGGMSVVLPLTALIRMRISALCLTNISAYNGAIGNAAGSTCFIIIAVGTAMFMIGVAIFISNYRYYSVKLKKSDMEYEIEKNLV